MEDDLSAEDKLKFNRYVMKAKELASFGKIEEAIKYNKQAYLIAPVDKIAKRICKLEVVFCPQCQIDWSSGVILVLKRGGKKVRGSYAQL